MMRMATFSTSKKLVASGSVFRRFGVGGPMSTSPLSSSEASGSCASKDCSSFSEVAPPKSSAACPASPALASSGAASSANHSSASSTAGWSSVMLSRSSSAPFARAFPDPGFGSSPCPAPPTATWSSLGASLSSATVSVRTFVVSVRMCPAETFASSTAAATATSDVVLGNWTNGSVISLTGLMTSDLFWPPSASPPAAASAPLKPPLSRGSLAPWRLRMEPVEAARPPCEKSGKSSPTKLRATASTDWTFGNRAANKNSAHNAITNAARLAGPRWRRGRIALRWYASSGRSRA
mmetsp:Transcript_45210/g.131558  ORF Transcript_45210/g.131558 Transcript_45210/m.131558 type:complete len:294 (-) Transcript_45210:69-950(-)